MNWLEIFKELLKFKTINGDDDGALNYISMLMDDFKPRFINGKTAKNLLLTKHLGSGPHICLAANIDVDGQDFTDEDFEPILEDDCICGAGANDMKSGLASELFVALNLLNFKGTLSILLTSSKNNKDYGINYVLKILQADGLLPDFVLLARPVFQNTLGEHICIGKEGLAKGSISLKASNDNSIFMDKISSLISFLNNYKFSKENEFFKKGKIEIYSIKTKSLTPKTIESIKIKFKIHFSSSDDLDDFKANFKEFLGDFDYELDINEINCPFLSNQNSNLLKALQYSIEEHCKIKPKLITNNIISDAKYFHDFGIDVFEFGVSLDQNDTKIQKVKISEIEKLNEILNSCILNLNSLNK